MENIEEHCENEPNEGETDSHSQVQPGLQRNRQPIQCPLTSTTKTELPTATSKTTTQGNTSSSPLDAKFEQSSKAFIRFNPTPHILASVASSAVRRIPHLHKLEKKHSSGDLHSRLKTRKLLGVGETDDGDIHRSKLSQILGHSDQLYIKLPYGLRVWQLIMAIMFTVTGLWALVSPYQLIHTSFGTDEDQSISLPIRLYGGAITSLSVVYWMTLRSQDRDILRMCLLSSIVYFTIQFVVSAFSSATLDSPVYTCFGAYIFIFWRFCQIAGSVYFYVVLTRDLRHYR